MVKNDDYKIKKTVVALTFTKSLIVFLQRDKAITIRNVEKKGSSTH